MKIERRLFVTVVDIYPGLKVGDVKSITERLNVGAKNEVARSE